VAQSPFDPQPLTGLGVDVVIGQVLLTEPFHGLVVMVSHIGVHHGISLPFQSSRQAPGPRSFDSKLLCNSIPDLLSENVVDGPIISLLLSKFKSKPSEPAMQSKSSDFIHTLLIFPFRAQGGFRPFLRRGGGILFLTIPYPQRRLFRHEKSHRSFIRPPAGAGQRP